RSKGAAKGVPALRQAIGRQHERALGEAGRWRLGGVDEIVRLRWGLSAGREWRRHLTWRVRALVLAAATGEGQGPAKQRGQRDQAGPGALVRVILSRHMYAMAVAATPIPQESSSSRASSDRRRHAARHLSE